MHRIVEYTGTPWDKEEAALHDCREWLGDATFEETMEKLQHSVRLGYQQKFIADCLCMLGIEGYPAEVMAMRALELVNAEVESGKGN